MDLERTGVLITGGGRGLGAALGASLARHGARVALVARSAQELDATVARIRSEGGEAHAIAADVGDKESVYPIAGAAQALVGPVAIVIHAASTLGAVPLPPLLDAACEDFERTLAVNLVGPFRITKALVGAMVLSGRGLVIVISSDAAVNGHPGWGMYGASKAALDQLARVWAAELEGTGVRVLAIDPGEMNTRMYHDAVPGADPATLTDPAVVAERIALVIEEAEQIPTGSRLLVSEQLPSTLERRARS